MYGQLKQEVGQNLSTVCKITGIQLIKGGVCPDHVHNKYGRHFWARGYYAETVGQVNEDTIMKYIEEQKESSRIEE